MKPKGKQSGKKVLVTANGTDKIMKLVQEKVLKGEAPESKIITSYKQRLPQLPKGR